MRKQITLFQDQYEFYKELKSKKLLTAFVEYMFEDIEPNGLNGVEKVVRNSLKVRMDNLKKKSYAGKQSHGGGRHSNTSGELDHKNNTTNNTKTTEQTTQGTTKKQEEQDNISNDILLEEDKEKNLKKKGFGEFKKCYLTDEEYEKVINDYGPKNAEILINKVDSYCASKGKQYKNYVAAIRNFAKNANIPKQPPPKKLNEYEISEGVYDLEKILGEQNDLPF